MKVEIIFEDDTLHGKPLTTIEITGSTEQEVENKLKNKKWWLTILLFFLHKLGLLKMKKITVKTGELIFTLEMILKRFEFLGLSEQQQIVMVDFCNGIARKTTAASMKISYHTVNSHIRNVRLAIGDFSDADLRKLLICSDQTFRELYYEKIEAYKLSVDCNYKKKPFT